MNAKVGKNIWTGIDIGTCRLHDERNDNGTRNTSNIYAVHQCVVTGGTLLPHRNIHKRMWHGHDNRTVNQTDHVKEKKEQTT
jgi:hypothetical protein